MTHLYIHRATFVYMPSLPSDMRAGRVSPKSRTEVLKGQSHTKFGHFFRSDFPQCRQSRKSKVS
jgi:hypothetical protein